MDLICPQCNQPIDPEDYNVSTDIAYCRFCDQKHSFSTLSSMEAIDQQAFDQFERSYCQELGREAIAQLPFNIVFRIVGLALTMSVLIVLVVLGILSQEETGDAFWIVVLALGGSAIPELVFAIFFLAGKYVVTIEHGLLQVYTGVFPMRLSKRIDFNRTTQIRIEKNSNVRVNGQPVDQIEVATEEKIIRFGVMLNAQNKACLFKWLAKHV